jgi:hypothetical protein
LLSSGVYVFPAENICIGLLIAIAIAGSEVLFAQFNVPAKSVIFIFKDRIKSLDTDLS